MDRRMKVTPETPWKDIPRGGTMLDGGNAVDFKTGDWRVMKPIWYEDKCKHCMFCWAVCPDMSIIVEDGKMTSIDYDHCKGCGVCVEQCNFKALELVDEE
ncbi:pyruvate synthase subunit PorD [Clostridium malenominatum]|uniref:Pyruvate synthase subunit PorD n=2 Tax=Clostridium malenominatum TaxID=1539 RepID=A0ABP3UF56_9CLOT